MIVVCDFENCNFNNSGFCTREILAIKRGEGRLVVPTCDLFVSQNAGTKGQFFPNEFARRKRKVDITIEDAEYKEIKDESINDKLEEVSTTGIETDIREETLEDNGGVSKERSTEEL
jgi:hypothetical protein